jgi:hypothetical protein
MKKIITTVALCLIASPAYAEQTRVESPRGISQSSWNASNTYRDFQCPDNTVRGEGMDMNFTTDKSDDYYFVECNALPITVTTPAIIPAPVDTATATTPIQNDTATTTTPTTTTTLNVTTDTTTVVTETATASVVNFNSVDWFSEFMTWFNNFIKQFYAILEGLKK